MIPHDAVQSLGSARDGTAPVGRGTMARIPFATLYLPVVPIDVAQIASAPTASDDAMSTRADRTCKAVELLIRFKNRFSGL